MRSLACCFFLLIAFLSASGQIRQQKKYFDGDSSKIREIFHFSEEDSTLEGSYESFYLNGSLQTFGWYHRNQPDSVWKYFYENGRPKATGRYKMGRPDGKWKYYYENGNLKSEGILNGAIKDGYWTFYYESGGEKSNGNYFSDQKSGIWNYFYEDGALKAQAYMENGKGRYTEFYPSGKRRMEGFNIDDKSTGEWTYYYESGEIEAIGSFKDGLKTGTWTYYHKNGIVAAKGQFRDGMRVGQWVYYHDNGKVSREGTLVQDQKDGYWKLFYPSGELLGEGHYEKGSGDYNEYYPGGSIKSKGRVLDGKKTGTWYYYGENGSLEGEADFEAGKGEYVGYYPNGSIKMKGLLAGDKRVGEWTLFNEDGSRAGTYYPIYEDERPIFKTRISSDRQEKGDYDKPEYKFKRKGFRYFQPTINEYRGIIIGTNPAWLFVNELPLAIEYYMQERLGYEVQMDILRAPFFTSNAGISPNEVYHRGTRTHFRQKFYSPDSRNGMFYFGHELFFKYQNHQVSHNSNGVRSEGNLIETDYGYGVFVGNRWMRDAGGSGYTIDIFIGFGIAARSFNKRYEPNAILDGYFDPKIKSTLHFPLQIGLNIGLVGPKSKSKTQ